MPPFVTSAPNEGEGILAALAVVPRQEESMSTLT